MPLRKNFVIFASQKTKILKRLIIIIFALFFSVELWAQYNQPSFLSVRMGMGIPYSKFTKGISTVNNGFASYGGAFVAEGAYFYSDNVGVGGLMGTSIFPVDQEEYGHQFVKNNCLYSSVIVDAEHYYTVYLMGGLYFDSRISRTKISLTGKILAGFYWVRNPAILFTYTFSNVASSRVFQRSENSTNFAIYYGLGAKFHLWKDFGLTADLDYVGSKFKFYYHTLEQGEGEASKQISFLSTTIGVFLKL